MTDQYIEDFYAEKEFLRVLLYRCYNFLRLMDQEKHSRVRRLVAALKDTLEPSEPVEAVNIALITKSIASQFDSLEQAICDKNGEVTHQEQIISDLAAELRGMAAIIDQVHRLATKAVAASLEGAKSLCNFDEQIVELTWPSKTHRASQDEVYQLRADTIQGRCRVTHCLGTFSSLDAIKDLCESLDGGTETGNGGRVFWDRGDAETFYVYCIPIFIRGAKPPHTLYAGTSSEDYQLAAPPIVRITRSSHLFDIIDEDGNNTGDCERVWKTSWTNLDDHNKSQAELLDEYNTLVRKLIEIREKNQGKYSPDEEPEILQRMIVVWEYLSEAEQDRIYAEGAKIPLPEDDLRQCVDDIIRW